MSVRPTIWEKHDQMSQFRLQRTKTQSCLLSSLQISSESADQISWRQSHWKFLQPKCRLLLPSEPSALPMTNTACEIFTLSEGSFVTATERKSMAGRESVYL